MSAESGSLTMELAKSLVENLDFGDAERVWERFRSEPPEPCDELPEDGPPAVIQEDLPRFIPERTGCHVQGLLFVL
jgi:hypothetical protein